MRCPHSSAHKVLLMSCSRRWASVGCRFLTHLRGPDARGGRRRRGGGGDIAAAGGLQARRGAPRLHSTSGARAAAICPRLRPCRRRRRRGSLGGGLAGGEAGGMLDYSFLATRAIMPLIWCCCCVRRRVGKGQTNSILVGEAYFTRIKCPSAPTNRTLDSKWERAEGGNIHRGGVLPLRSVAMSPTSTQSRLQSARLAPCRHRIDASPTKM